ncbi:RteC domain-containing protein [Olivibacter jilunii]|uniref:RteC domain-containing protein n=1 Tax=Olivibacter jilunii TaxID=985016 RepID=UPI00102FEA6B|nr:RteC domain-containing protein [Olivibacter jilunii]
MKTILDYSDMLFRELSDEMAITEQEELTARQETAKKLLIARSYLQKLKEHIVGNAFENQQEEITFFKYKKPLFVSQVLYFAERQRINLIRPEGTAEQLNRYYRYLLEGIEKFYTDNRELYSYYRSGYGHLDHLLFLRSVPEPPSWLCAVDRADYDERFSVPADNLIGKIICNEYLVRYLGQLLEGKTEEVGVSASPEMTWTGESINLLETAYGWYCTGQINNGQAGIGEIVRKLETVFNVKIGRPYRRFAEIKQRKRLSRTKFIDDMGKAIVQKLDDEDAYRPERR